jgi:hypothetical protein
VLPGARLEPREFHTLVVSRVLIDSDDDRGHQGEQGQAGDGKAGQGQTHDAPASCLMPMPLGLTGRQPPGVSCRSIPQPIWMRQTLYTTRTWLEHAG